MNFNILDNTTELWMTKYITGEIFSSGGATLYKNPYDQTVLYFGHPEPSLVGSYRNPSFRYLVPSLFSWNPGFGILGCEKLIE